MVIAAGLDVTEIRMNVLRTIHDNRFSNSFWRDSMVSKALMSVVLATLVAVTESPAPAQVVGHQPIGITVAEVDAIV
jgi:hypothetical protein